MIEVAAERDVPTEDRSAAAAPPLGRGPGLAGCLVAALVAVVAVPVVLIVVIVVAVALANTRATSARGSANPSAYGGAAGELVALPWGTATVLPSGAPTVAVAGATAVTVDGLTVAAVGRSGEDDQTGQLVATGADGTVAWRSARHRSAVIGLWSDGARLYSFWRRTHDNTSGISDEGKVSTTDMLVVLEPASGRELWWIPTYADDVDRDFWMLASDVDTHPAVALAVADGVAVLTVSSGLRGGAKGPSYLVAVDLDGRAARWRAAASCAAAVEGRTLLLACAEGATTVDVLTAAALG